MPEREDGRAGDFDADRNACVVEVAVAQRGAEQADERGDDGRYEAEQEALLAREDGHDLSVAESMGTERLRGAI
jgi:hypothetical protein